MFFWKAKLFARPRSLSGFTLIELMVAVAIIGLLAAIAMPNYQKHTNRSHQAEAKLNLAGLYTAERSFYSEYTAYVPSFVATGYSPEGANLNTYGTKPRRWYYLGWNGSTFTNTITGYNGSFGNSQIVPFAAPSSWGSCPQSPPDALAAPYNTDDPQSFTAMAVAMLPNVTTCDVWTIDNNKILKNINIGL